MEKKMRPYFKYMINNKRKKYLKDKKLRPIRIKDFIIQPVIINPFKRDHRFIFDASFKPISETIKKQIFIKRKQNKIFYTRTTVSYLSDIIDLAFEEIYYLTRPKFLFNLHLMSLT